MDRYGRAPDNIFVERLWRSVKYEGIYLKGYGNMAELPIGLAQHFVFYNGTRPHQSLGYRTPADVYRSGSDGGALIVDKYGQTSIAEAGEPCPEPPLEDTLSSGPMRELWGSAEQLQKGRQTS